MIGTKSLKNMKKSIKILANSPVAARSMGGGDRLFLEMLRHFSTDYDISFFGCEESVGMVKLNKIKVKTTTFSRFAVSRFGLVRAYLLRSWRGLKKPLPIEENETIYSASEYWPDLAPIFPRKRKKKFFWIVGLYLINKNPFLGQVKFGWRQILTFLAQRIGFLILKKYADLIFVLCQADKDDLSRRGFENKRIIVVSGGVDLDFVRKIKAPKEKKYDAVFVGRFHPQKGLPDLFRAWQKVTLWKQNARLAIIGWGDKAQVAKTKQLIANLNLGSNVELLGFLDGEAKWKILKSAEIFVFPSNHESWGFVAVEAMAADLPVIAYDLAVYRQTFGSALLSCPLYNWQKLGDNIIELLSNSGVRQDYAQKSSIMAKKFDWEIIISRIEKETTRQYQKWRDGKNE